MRKTPALALASALLFSSAGFQTAAAQNTPGFNDLAARETARPAAQVNEAQRKADRQTILFLAAHVKELEVAIAEARKVQQQIMEEARRAEEEAKRRADEAERRRREANSRAAGNALLLIAGADPKDINTYNRVMDIHDVLTAKTPESRQAAERRTYAPTALLLLGADVQTVNDLDQFSSTVNAFSQAGQARTMKGQLQQAQRNTQAAQNRSMSLDDSIKAMDSERSKALDLLQGYSKRYLGQVNSVVAGVPGFVDNFGQVKDIAFDFSLSADSPEPLIHALTFQIRGDTVDVRLTDIEQFLNDHFAGLIASREAVVAQLAKALEQKQSDVTALNTQRSGIQSQIQAKESEKANLPGFRNLLARNRIDRDIEALKLKLPTAAADTSAATAVSAKKDELRKAQALVARAKAARDMLGKIDETKAHAALAQVRALL